MKGNQLPNPLLILFFLVLLRDASTTSKPQYLVLVPYQLYTGVPERACVMLSRLNETVTLKIILDYGMQISTLLTETVTEKNAFFCSPFTIPKLFTSSGVITVEVRGPTQQFIKKKIINIRRAESVVIAQTDKPIYKPGQEVRFRIVSVNVNFHPVNETFSVVYIENPKKNRIIQWQSVRLQGGLSQFSFPLSMEPTLGTYTIKMEKESGGTLQFPFEVKEYVLPRFEVQVKMPRTIGFLDEEFVVTACGLYTYGKPVSGLVTINVCRKYSRYRSNCHGRYSQSICEEFSQQADSKGCLTQLVKTKIFQLRQKGYDMEIQVEAKVKEEGTELELTGHGSSTISNTLSKLKFTKVDMYFGRGIPFFGQVLLVNEKDQPIPNKTVVVTVNVNAFRSTFITDENGLADISIDTSDFTFPSFTVTVTYKENTHCFDDWWLQEFHTSAQHTVRHISSPSKSYVHLESVTGTVACGQIQEIRAQYILNEEILKDEKDLTFYYLIKARGIIARSGTHVLSIERGNMKGVFAFSFQVEPDIAFAAQLLLYSILPNGEIIADTKEIDTENCFANKVGLSFSSVQSLPASNINLEVSATRHSLCGLRVVDQSVLLMKPRDELSPQLVYDLLPPKKAPTFMYGGFIDDDENDEKCTHVKDIVHDGIIYTPKWGVKDDDVLTIFAYAGVKIFTNSEVYSTSFCHLPPPYPLAYAEALPQALPQLAPGMAGRIQLPVMHASVPAMVHSPMKETIRKYFPETWIWDLVPLDSSGKRELTVKVPDTITEWKASALCLSENTGLGLSPIISLQVFQPFFVELTLPYSVVRGEAFTLKATVFNYLSHCIRVTVQLDTLPDNSADLVKKDEATHCVCGTSQKTVSWAVTPKSLGKVNFTATVEALQSQELCGNEMPIVPELGQKDTVVKPLLVEPEGIEQEKTFNTLLCASETGVSEKLSLKVPSDVVEGSARAMYSVLGDILGSAMRNLQNLLQMPYGCGEQNMVLFVPNIYVLNYLNETGQLTENIKSKAISYLVSGYQRQLNYKHGDGSYSTFGEHYGTSEGNTWLTAFVLKSFAQARSYIFVDNSHIKDSLTWLSQKQKENGCFQRSGSLLNNAIKGGVDDEVTLSAYITIALLEMPLAVTEPVVRNALFCLENAWKAISESEAQGNPVYTKALLAYAFALARNQAKRKELLESLDKDAVKEGESIHWQRPEKVQEVLSFYYEPRAPSVEVEMTSYLLLAHLTAWPAPSSEDLSVASKIVKWITKQQNPNGGFSSTQDTVVALQALSKYGAATFSKMEKASVITVKSSETFSKEFQVHDANRLLFQEIRLPEIPGEYTTTVSGSGCVYIQTSLRYNVLPKKERKAPFTLTVDILPKNCDGVDAHRKLQIHINISYTGERPSSNMAIVDVKMISGFIPVKSSVRRLQEKPQIQRTEVSTNHVLIYFEELTNQTLSFSFSVEQDIQVNNLKPATIKAYDYYETEEFTIEEYSDPCSAESEHRNT
ncbi:pregnancy zone protein-like [Hyaena hyaena]|uniref:pregnancy zone protein-like n=1 Tax=Hyaena hyaena TaxID=95912 RepID=UPI0019212BF8|nr:pregnancy zone protein-like [Hyaena hyaena]